jgi:membrane protein implicated in regulation of membrane protease activity
MTWLEGIDAHWIWLIAAALLGIAELVVPGVFFIWVAAAAAVTGFATLFFDLSVALQFGLFSLLALAAVYLGRRWYADNPVESSDPLLNDRASRLVGQVVVTVSPIENGIGRCKVGDSVWNCRGPDSPEGARVRIVGADGTCLIVEPAAA